MEKAKRTPEEQAFLDMFGDNLRKFREKNNLTQEYLAEKADTSATVISDYERGMKAASILYAKKLADALGTTMDSLCGIDNEIQQQNGFENMPILAILAVLKQFQAQVHVTENEITLTVSSDNDCSTYSSKEIINFFKEYEMIQTFANSTVQNNLGNDMVETLLSSLKGKYKHLPGLPEYKFPPKNN